MPTVPFHPLPSESAAPLPVVRRRPPYSPVAPIEAFGGGKATPQGPELFGAEQASNRIAEQQRQEREHAQLAADQVAITDAGSQLSTLKTHLLYNQNDGALTQLGKNSFDAPERVNSQYWDTVNVIRASLTSDQQRLAFDRMAADQYAGISEQVQRHVAQQIKAYDTDTTQSFVANKRNEAIQQYNDPAAVEDSIAYQTAAIKDHGSRNGLPEESVTQQVNAAKSATRFSVLSQYLDNGQDLSASAYLNAHRDDFQGKDLLEAEKLTESGSVLGEGQRQADGILRTTNSRADAVNATASISDARVRARAEQLIRQHYVDLAADQRAAQQQTYTAASKLVEDGKPVPLSMREQLTPTQNGDLQRRANEIAHPRTYTDPDTYMHLMNMSALSDQSRAEFEKTDLSQYAGSLSSSDMNKLLSKQQSLRLQTESRARSDSVSKAKAADKKAAADKAKQGILDSLMGRTPPKVPGAPLPNQQQPQPTAKAPVVNLSPATTGSKPPEDENEDDADYRSFDDETSFRGVDVPDDWRADDDPEYQAYLQEMGVG